MKTHLSILALIIFCFSLSAQDEFGGWWEEGLKGNYSVKRFNNQSVSE